MGVQAIRCDAIRPDPRSDGYPPQAVQALADDIRERGILRPVLLRETSDGYVIVHGERRWRAACLLGMTSIPAFVVQDFSHGDSATQYAGFPDRPSNQPLQPPLR